MRKRPGQGIRLEGERRALRGVLQLLVLAAAIAAVPIVMGTLMRMSNGTPWADTDWWQLAALIGVLIVALMTAIGLIRRQGRRTLAVNFGTITAAALSFVCTELLLNTLGRAQPLTIDYGSYLIMIGAAVGFGLFLIFMASRR